MLHQPRSATLFTQLLDLQKQLLELGSKAQAADCPPGTPNVQDSKQQYHGIPNIASETPLDPRMRHGTGTSAPTSSQHSGKYHV